MPRRNPLIHDPVRPDAKDGRTGKRTAAAAAPEPPRPTAAPAALPPHRTAADLLAGLRAVDSRLPLTERDVRRLAPAVSAWLDRGVPATAVRRTLTTACPRTRSSTRRPSSPTA
ncbi:hypothetical protein [Streptomyces bullii]|uniref:hypothetical protein n=1 Tax=Streptomyces bullii TaxID=349910 RepID=UPI0036D377AA